MPDEIDRAQARADQYREDCERERKFQAAKLPRATGECLYCGEPLADGKKFCGVECRDGWEKEQRLMRIAGGRHGD